ncbi:non-homologous end-joining DNA ligase [Fictibacillus aquaticus]|uniref:non-homologous end-joining DNA ligase n=1 Tax=Fictibacillus aquaticus TaxID=2021314 RepID=UPI001F0A9161|nr:non-homologous end-joining DNA ligase [Fictibacillus aquaticus]
MGKRYKEQHNININGAEVTITSPDKPVWPEKGLVKLQYLQYLSTFAPYILPFLSDRTLTLIRYPHGIDGERFYQKNCPDYAPDFVKTFKEDSIEYVVCSNLETLLWLGNQLALELHIPFRKVSSRFPSEIVMDLDPPSRKEFHLAAEAGLIIKEVCDSLGLITFIKTSGNKGMQVYVPLPDNRFTFDDTRIFTCFLATYLVTKEPRFFTTERLKKNRGSKCYIDFIQHAEGKTIIAPYSARGNKEALVAAPLFWNEVSPSLNPEDFSVDSMEERLNKLGDPFKEYFITKDKQPFERVLTALKENSS